MERKLVKQGAATLMVSLPAEWTKGQNLKKGSSVNIVVDDKRLVITGKGGQEKKETSVRLLNMTESAIRTKITNTYRSGFDKIKVYFQNKKQLEILSSVVKTRLIGFEVTEVDEESCVVENMTEPAYEQFDTVLKKVFLNIDQLLSVTYKRLLGQEPDQPFEEIEERIQRYDNFCRRVIVKRGKEHSEFLWSFLTLVIHGNREIYHLNHIIEEMADSNIIELFMLVQEIFQYLKKGFTDKDREALSKIHDLEKELIYDKGYTALSSKSGKYAYHILVAGRQFYQANSPLFGMLF